MREIGILDEDVIRVSLGELSLKTWERDFIATAVVEAGVTWEVFVYGALIEAANHV